MVMQSYMSGEKFRKLFNAESTVEISNKTILKYKEHYHGILSFLSSVDFSASHHPCPKSQL